MGMEVHELVRSASDLPITDSGTLADLSRGEGKKPRTFLEQLHAERKARLVRLGAPSPYQAPITPFQMPAPIKLKPPRYPKFNPAIAWYHTMWFWELIELPPKAEFSSIPATRRIVAVVADHFGVTVEDINSPQKHKLIVRPRQVAMYLTRKLTRHSTTEIGRRIGDRDHSTVINAIRMIESILAISPEMQRSIAKLTAELAR